MDKHKQNLLRHVKEVLHVHYDPELQKYYNHKRYVKERKRFKKKRDRLKAKRNLNTEVLDEI